MTENDIKSNFAAFRELIGQSVAADLALGERQAVLGMLSAGLTLLESLFLDINKLATCAEEQLRRANPS